MSDEVSAKIAAQGLKIRELKAAKASKEAIDPAVAILKDLKTQYKAATGTEWAPPQSSNPPPAPAKKKEKAKAEGDKKPEAKDGGEKVAKKQKKTEESSAAAAPTAFKAPKGIVFYPSILDSDENMKVWLLASEMKGKVNMATAEMGAIPPDVPRLPALSDKNGSQIRFGGNAICKYLLEASGAEVPEITDEVCALEEMSSGSADKVLAKIESLLAKIKDVAPVLACVLYPLIKRLGGSSPACASIVGSVEAYAAFNSVFKKTQANLESLESFDYRSAGLQTSLRLVFSHAIVKAFPETVGLQMYEAQIVRCGNPNFGDFQCNNAMTISKALKVNCGIAMAPKDVADKIAASIPANPLTARTTTAPNGFINITLSESVMAEVLSMVVTKGPEPPYMKKLKVAVDFSSPNIAKEMHVGHLRSTIIGDSVCRILEYCGHEVLRINHVGDWGTQFGMLITYLLEAYPDILTNPPNISDLTAIYKASKKRFDDDEKFKETSRLNVVRLQSGDEECRKIWNLLCDISRKEFQNVYDLLDVTLEEVGESFYNPMIPGVITKLESCKLTVEDDGMLIVKLKHFTIPLIVRKSDGGFGYDSTDMAAINYRLFDKKADWLIYITDAGQANHFYMVFDAAKAAGWLRKNDPQRLDHIGFGVVCGDDGKRFKTRSSETVRLIDLLQEAKVRMKGTLTERKAEGKTQLTEEEIEDASGKIGYGAVKYFDLKQNPSTNYIFNYDRMLDTKGDTAVYLLFAYARVASILRKASSEKGKDLSAIFARAPSVLQFGHPAERALAFEVMQLGDTIRWVLKDLLPNRLCQYLSNLCVAFSDFVTRCNVLNSDEIESRLVLCEATRKVMEKCFELLGIKALDKI